jgi:hypothetical protein
MKRIQRQRTRGWRMPEGAIIVSRPSLWGNPYTLDDVRVIWPEIPPSERAAAAVGRYREELTHFGLLSDYAYMAPGSTIEAADRRWETVHADIEASGAKNMGEYAVVALRGHDLVCWCGLCDVHRDGLPAGVECPDCPPCHADVLLELAQ